MLRNIGNSPGSPWSHSWIADALERPFHGCFNEVQESRNDRA